MNSYIERVLADVKKRDAHEPEFLQTVEEVLSSLEVVVNQHPEYEKAGLLERLVEPEKLCRRQSIFVFDRSQARVPEIQEADAIPVDQNIVFIQITVDKDEGFRLPDGLAESGDNAEPVFAEIFRERIPPFAAFRIKDHVDIIEAPTGCVQWSK